jgi:hypothetical protein
MFGYWAWGIFEMLPPSLSVSFNNVNMYDSHTKCKVVHNTPGDCLSIQEDYNSTTDKTILPTRESIFPIYQSCKGNG